MATTWAGDLMHREEMAAPMICIDRDAFSTAAVTYKPELKSICPANFHPHPPITAEIRLIGNITYGGKPAPPVSEFGSETGLHQSDGFARR